MTAMKEEMFILLTCFIACSAVLFSSAEQKNGELKPMDPDVCTTQNITFTSSLLIPPKANFSIGFEIKKTANFSVGFDIKEFGKYVVVDHDRVTQINETVSQLTVYNITVKDEDITEPVYFYVRSFYWQDFGSTSNNLQLGDTTSTRVYPIPEKVKDFQCIVINYMSMRCSWKYGIEYGDKDDMPTVTFKWRIPIHTASWTDCRYLNKEGYCDWNETEAGDFKNRNITVRIILAEKCGINVSSEFDIDTSKIVKPNPVSRISSSVINSTCIRLDWEATNSEPQKPKEHRVNVSRDGEYVTNKTIVNTIDTVIRLQHGWTFCGLHPYTKYKFSVTIKPSGFYSGYFSEPRYSESTTYSDKPSASPEVTEGGYNWNLRDCNGNKKQRRVCIFMKSVKGEDTNGPMKGLEGHFTAISGDEQSFTKHWAEYVTYGCSSLLCTTSYNFTIKARNVNGTADTASALSIPAFTSGTERPQFIVESANTSDVYVSWDDRSTSKATGFLVAWCRNENGECKSDHEVYWKRFPSNTKEAVLQINTSAHDFLYGVSVLTEQGSSGVEWQDCVYLKDISPTRKPQNVIVSEGSEYNTLVVTWDKLTCNYDQPYIDKYNLVYKKVDNVNTKSINVSQSGEARVVLRGLDEDQTYTVTLRAVTRDGRYGPETEPLSGVPVNKELKPPLIAGISMAVLVVVIFAGVGIVCAVRKCKRKTQKAIEKAGAITIPIDPLQESYNIFQRQNSNDSGCGMTPPPDISKRAILGDSSLVLPYGYRCATVGNVELGSTTTDTNTLKLEPSRPATDGADPPSVSKESSDVTNRSTRGLMSNRGNNAINGISEDGITVGYVSCNSAPFDTVGKSQTDSQAIEFTSMRSNHLLTNAFFGDNEERESETEFVDSLPNAKSLTTIPTPMHVCGNDLAVSDENEFQLAQTEDICQDSKDITSATLAFQSPVRNNCKNNEFHCNETLESDETSTKNNLEGSTKAIYSSYVMTTEQAKILPQNPSDTNSKSALRPKSGTIVASLDNNGTFIIEQTAPTFPPVNSYETSDSSHKTDTVHDKTFAEEYTTASGYPSNSVPQPVSNPFEMQTTGKSTIQTKIDSSLCDIKHNTTYENALTDGYIPHPDAVEGKQICDNISDQTKSKDTVPNVNINANCAPSQEVQSHIPEAIMEKVSDQKRSTDSLFTPTAYTLTQNVNPGYVSSMEDICQPNESKFKPDGRNVLKDKQEDNNTSHTDSSMSCPLTGPNNHTEYTNARLEATEGKCNASFQGCVTDVFLHGLEKEELNLKQNIDTERGLESICMQMNKDGYVTH